MATPHDFEPTKDLMTRCRVCQKKFSLLYLMAQHLKDNGAPDGVTLNPDWVMPDCLGPPFHTDRRPRSQK